MHNAIAHHLLTDAQPVPKQQSAPPSQLPQVYILDVTSYGMKPLASLGQLSWLCALQTSCAPPAFLLAGYEKLKNP